jgi:hypothetical protein
VQLLVDISAHGLGHLAQTAPVLNALRPLLPELRLTVRSALPGSRLAARIGGDFAHIEEASDFGFVMHSAVDVDCAASAACYREFHADWQQRVRAEADWLRRHRVDAVLCNAAYLPLAAAAEAGIPAVGMSSLNWADMYAHYLGGEPGAAAIHAQILGAYNAARCFLRLTPGMSMADFRCCMDVAPVACVGRADRSYFSRALGLDESKRWLLVAMGGMDFPIDFAAWPRAAGACWLLQGAGRPARDDQHFFDPGEPRFSDLLASADAVITKPGYGTFVEAACAGTPMLYLERDDWLETPHFARWLAQHARAVELRRDKLLAGDFMAELEALLARPAPPSPLAEGAGQAARLLAGIFGARSAGRGGNV